MHVEEWKEDKGRPRAVGRLDLTLGRSAFSSTVTAECDNTHYTHVEVEYNRLVVCVKKSSTLVAGIKFHNSIYI